MFKQYLIAIFLLAVLLTSCNNCSPDTANGHSNETQTAVVPAKEAVDTNFNDFIEKFSIDSVFQISRTKFPLKVEWHEVGERDSIFHIDKLEFEIIDFRQKKSTGQYDQSEQYIVVDTSNTSAIIRIRGIDNGIRIDYLFEKINEAWMFVEIDDSST
jgi:hypothetical protein